MSNSFRGVKKSQEADILFCVSGLPPECKWQDLKDSLRYDRKMRARPGWTDVMIQMSSGTAVRQGIFKIKSFEEANRVYYCLSQGLRDGTRLQVHQWDISKYPPSLLNCNCSTVFGTSGHSSQLSTMGSQIANQLSQQFVQIAPVQTATDQVIGGWDPQSTPTIVIAGAENAGFQTYPLTSAPSSQKNASPLLYTAPNAVPVNTSQGTFPSKSVFSGAGRARTYEMRRDSEPGRSCGPATAIFRYEKDVHAAIAMESTPLIPSEATALPTQPVIVNGSTPYGRS